MKKWFSVTPWSHEYSKMLLARVDALGLAGAEIEKVRANPQPYQPDDACELELLLLRQMSADQLRHEIRGLRTRASAVAGIAPMSSAGRPPSDAEILAEAIYLVSAIQKGYVLNDEVEKTRRRMVLLMTLIAAVVLGVWFAGATMRGTVGSLTNGVVVLGVMGGYTSCLRRVSTLVAGTDQIAAIQALSASRSSMVAAPILGVIFSLLLLLCFQGGLVKGAVFPNLEVIPNTAFDTPFLQFLFGTVKAANEDFAKLLVWSFIAGFSERLMPDMIDRLVAKSSKS